LHYSFENRPTDIATLEQEVEANLSKRMRKYLPTNFDLVDYDRDLLKKQLDLETVQVALNKEESVGLD
jgi:hypothetical protein